MCTMHRFPNSVHDFVRIISHNRDASDEGILLEILCILYFVYGEFIFKSR